MIPMTCWSLKRHLSVTWQGVQIGRCQLWERTIETIQPPLKIFFIQQSRIFLMMSYFHFSNNCWLNYKPKNLNISEIVSKSCKSFEVEVGHKKKLLNIWSMETYDWSINSKWFHLMIKFLAHQGFQIHSAFVLDRISLTFVVITV